MKHEERTRIKSDIGYQSLRVHVLYVIRTPSMTKEMLTLVIESELPWH